MKRGNPLIRRKPLRSGSVLPKRNRKRAAMREQRDFGEYAEWIRRKPCVLWFVREDCFAFDHHSPIYRSEAAHVKSRGAGGRSLGNLIPLCHGHHAEQHALGIKSFAAKYGIDIAAVASALAARYQEETGQ